METIVKTISSEDAKNRFFSNNMPYISSNDLTKKDDGKCWGNYPMDVKITSGDTYHMYDIKDNLPLVNNNGEYIFRYYNIKDLRIWLENFIKECTFYKKAYRGGSYRWYQVDGDFYSGDTLDIYTMLGDDISANVCDVVCVNSNADIFNNIFRLSGDTTRYELFFIEFVDDIFSNSKTYEYSIPYFNLPVYIDSIGKTIGDMVTDEQEWTPGKKYFIGDIVTYNNTYYILKKGENFIKYELNGELYKIVSNEYYKHGRSNDSEVYYFIEDSGQEFNPYDDFSTDKIIISHSLINDSFSMFLIYYIGEYDDETEKMSFDNDSKKHWSLLTKTGVIETETGVIETETNNNIVIPSKLNEFVSVRRSYLDPIDPNDDSKLLPYVLNNDEIILPGCETYIPYILGYTNYTVKDGVICVDLLNEVTFLINVDDVSGITKTINDTLYTNGRVFLNQDITTEYKWIKFTYYIGCNIVNDKQDLSTGIKYTETTGIKYTETRSIDIYNETISYDGRNISVKGCTIGSSTFESSNYNINDKPCAIAEYNKSSKAFGLHTFSDDRLFGNVLVENDNTNINVNRGNYTAIERHNILGEVNSMDDLKNYRNNFFKL